MRPIAGAVWLGLAAVFRPAEAFVVPDDEDLAPRPHVTEDDVKHIDQQRLVRVYGGMQKGVVIAMCDCYVRLLHVIAM